MVEAKRFSSLAAVAGEQTPLTILVESMVATPSLAQHARYARVTACAYTYVESRIYLNQRARAYPRRVIVDAPTATGRLSNSRLVCTYDDAIARHECPLFPSPFP